MPIKDKGVFSQVGLDGDSEDTSDLNKYRNKVQHKNGSDYENDKPVSPGYLDEEALDEGMSDKIKKAAIVVATIVASFTANAQSDGQNIDLELKQEIKNDPRFSGWSDGAINKVFDLSKEVEAPLKQMEKLDLGKYSHVVSMVKEPNRTANGGFEYEIDISSKSHMGVVINDIKKRNKIPGANVKVFYRGGHSASNDFTL